MMVMHHAPPFPSDRVAYYFSPVLPAWTWMTSDCLTLHHHHHLPHCLGNPTLWDIFAQLTSWLSVYWPLWLAAVAGPGQYHWNVLYPWCTPELSLVQFWTFFSLIFFYPPCCGTNMLAMFCIRACSGLVGCRTATRALSLHSFPGITVAQVGLCFCLHVCVWQKFPVIKCCL